MLPGTSNISETPATRVQHKSNTSATLKTRMRHECYTNNTSVTRVKNFDFDNHTRKNIASHPYIYYMASGRLKGEEQFHSKNYFLEMSLFHVKIGLKSAQQQLNFLMEKTSAKSFTLDCSYKCPCTFPHSYQQ